MLSLQASYAAPLILLAQNRQDDRDRVNLEQDRKQNERSIADTEYLTREIAALRMGLGEVATRDWIRSELQDLVKELERRGATAPPIRPASAAPDVTKATADGAYRGCRRGAVPFRMATDTGPYDRPRTRCAPRWRR